MNSRPPQFSGIARLPQARRTVPGIGMLVLCLGSIGTTLAGSFDPGRLFYTPTQRAQLEAARARNVTRPGPGQPAASDSAPAPLRYDGVVIRSDGQITRWVDGKPQVGASRIEGLKPGQIRADGKVYEPYQVLRPVTPSPGKPDLKETAP